MSDLDIRRIDVNLAEQLTELWRAAFPNDPSDYIDSFFAGLPQDAVTLAGESNGEIATMLFLLPAEARFCGEIYPVRYLYAGCTHPLHRGQGYYRELLAIAAQTVAAIGENAIYLHPADEKLTATYKRLGYRPGIFGGNCVKTNEKLHTCSTVDEYMQKRDELIGRISQSAVFWNTSADITRFFVADATSRGAAMVYNDDRAELSFENTVIESIRTDSSRENGDYCLWLPIGDSPLMDLMGKFEGVTGLVGD